MMNPIIANQPSFLLTDEQLEKLKTIPDDIVRDFVSVYEWNKKHYHLNPDLIVGDDGTVVLCGLCAADPMKHKYSLANGHDYGRRRKFPALKGTSLSVSLPVRPFNIDILLRENHATGHSICFPSNGPVAAAKELPCVDDTRRPSVTFLGPNDKWMKDDKNWKHVYTIDPDLVYEALRIWISLGNKAFDGISIIDTDKMRELLVKVCKTVEDNVVVTENADIIGVADFVDDEEEDQAEKMTSDNVNKLMGSSFGRLVHSAVLPNPSLVEIQEGNNALRAFLEIIKPKKKKTKASKVGDAEDGGEDGEDGEDEEDEEDGEDNEAEDEEEAQPRKGKQTEQNPVIVVERDNEAVTEWDENDVLLRGAFPYLFLLGLGLPKGEALKSFLEHCWKYYDGRFEDPMWIATMFSQKQRHACIRKTARVASGNPRVLERLGRLANSKLFRDKLVNALANPGSKEAKKLNSSICRVLSLVGKAVPFSPFERVSTRPMLQAMRFRYSPLAMFHTAAPPEFEDVTVLRLALITQFNDKSCKLTETGFQRQDLPDELLSDAGIRMQLTKCRPVLGAQAFIRAQKMLNNDILKLACSSDTRISRNYTERCRGAFGQVAAHNTVIEPQKSGRLHSHKCVYLSALNPTLFNRLAAGPIEFVTAVGKVLDSLTCMQVPQKIHSWFNSFECTLDEKKGGKRPRAADILVGDAHTNYEAFIDTAMQKCMLTNLHKHGFSCEVTCKGKWMCRLALPRGVHDGETAPYFVRAEHLGNPSKGIRAKFDAIKIDEETEAVLLNLLDSPYFPLDGVFMHPHLDGAIIWEIQRPHCDSMFVESNLIVSNLLQCHNNASIITGKDAGEAVEEYTCAYMIKEGASLQHAAAVLLASIDHIHTHVSKAANKGTVQRTGMHLAQRTINAFSGSHQWSMPLMVYALHNLKSYETTESFTFVFPHDNVSFCERLHGNQHTTHGADSGCLGRSKSDAMLDGDDDGDNENSLNTKTELTLEELLADIDNENESEASGGYSGGGATSYKVDGKCIFLNQAISYANRGPNFDEFGQMEFECIIELLKKRSPTKKATIERRQRGRPERRGFDLGPGHPLYSSHQGFIRMKLKTPMLGGHPPPTFPGNQPQITGNSTMEKIELEKIERWRSEMICYAKYIICLIVPWSLETRPVFALDGDGLATLLHKWDRRTAALVNRQRFRYINNLMCKGNRSSRNEQIASSWRERNADWWSELSGHNFQATGKSKETEDMFMDNEAGAKLTSKELHQLTCAIVAGKDLEKGSHIASLQNMCVKLHSPVNQITQKPTQGQETSDDTATQQVVFQRPTDDNGGTTGLIPLSLAQIKKQIYEMTLPDGSVDGTTATTHTGNETGPMEIDLGGQRLNQSTTTSNEHTPSTLTDEQQSVVTKFMVDVNEQKLIFLHSGGGTGKSTVVRELNKQLREHGWSQANTCPTGVGATHLPDGRTFHSLFKTHKPELNAACDIMEMKKKLGGNKLKLVVVDEVSMLECELLVLLDRRLKSMYRPNMMFGGISILLLGDFLQLPPVQGRSLYSVMYGTVTGKQTPARALFAAFEVIELTAQLRASECIRQQALLQGFRELPTIRPNNPQWSKTDCNYQPMSNDIVDALTTELTRNEVIEDDGWTTNSTVVTTSNLDRSVLNAKMAEIYGSKKNLSVIRWQRKLLTELPQFVMPLLYAEDRYPELHGYFVYGAPAQILDNGNGNVCYGVANGTPCRMVALGWDGTSVQKDVLDLIEQSSSNHGANNIINIPTPPDYIIVELTVANQKTWPKHLNLSSNPGLLHIPIGLKTSRGGAVQQGRHHIAKQNEAPLSSPCSRPIVCNNNLEESRRNLRLHHCCP
jgi:hypothetical protein